MMKSGAPPDKFEVLYRMVTYNLIPRVITLWFLVLSQFFRVGIGPFNIGPSYVVFDKHFGYKFTTETMDKNNILTLSTRNPIFRG